MKSRKELRVSAGSVINLINQAAPITVATLSSPGAANLASLSNPAAVQARFTHLIGLETFLYQVLGSGNLDW